MGGASDVETGEEIYTQDVCIKFHQLLVAALYSYGTALTKISLANGVLQEIAASKLREAQRIARNQRRLRTNPQSPHALGQVRRQVSKLEDSDYFMHGEVSLSSSKLSHGQKLLTLSQTILVHEAFLCGANHWFWHHPLEAKNSTKRYHNYPQLQSLGCQLAKLDPSLITDDFVLRFFSSY